MEIKNNVFTRLLFFIFLSFLFEQKTRTNKKPSEWMNRMAWRWRWAEAAAWNVCIWWYNSSMWVIFHFHNLHRYRKCKQLKETGTETGVEFHMAKIFLPTHKSSSSQCLWHSERLKKMKENFHHQNVAQFVSWAGIKLRVLFAIQDTHNNNFECVI